jgi:hypothetical protein
MFSYRIRPGFHLHAADGRMGEARKVAADCSSGVLHSAGESADSGIVIQPIPDLQHLFGLSRGHACTPGCDLVVRGAVVSQQSFQYSWNARWIA